MPAQSRFLQGSFAPVPSETTAFDLPVTGRVPQVSRLRPWDFNQ